MRPLLAFGILMMMAATAATSQGPATAQGRPQTAQATTGTTGGDMGTSEIDLVKWGFTQGGLTLVLIVVLASYRRDFFRKVEAKQAEIDALRREKQQELEAVREEKRMLSLVIDKNSDAMLKQALAVAANTDATRQLAQNVDKLADRRREPR